MARSMMRRDKKTESNFFAGRVSRRSREMRRARVLVEALEDRVLLSTITVTTLADSGAGSLRAAIAASSSGDVVAFSSSLSGVIDLTTAGDSSAGPAAFGITDSITIDGSASPTGITIERSNSAGDMRLFNIASGASLTLVNLTIANGIAQGGDGGDGFWSGGAGAGLGGAIFNQGTLVVKGSTLTGNQAIGGDAVLYNNNPGGGGGGGLDGTPADSDPSSGFGAAGAGPNAGAGGTSSTGGGVGGFGGGGGGGAGFNLNASNQAGGNGGFGGGGGAAGTGSNSDAGGNGGFGGGGGGGGGFPSPNDGTGGFGGGNGVSGVGGAGGGMGGAIFNDAGTVQIVNSTLTADSAVGGSGTSGSGDGSGYGGAVFNLNGALTINDATLSSNTAAQGGTDVYNLANGSAATVVANNSIMGQTSNSVSDYVDQGISASATSSGVGDLIRSTTTFGGTSVSSADPVLGSLAGNGGLTQTLLPGAGSPAIDAGSNSAIPSGLTTDQRGDTRINDSVVDIGSVETPSANVAPSVTSATAATFIVGTTSTFTITTTGTPTPAITESGPIGSGLHFTDNGNGTAMISGDPGAGTGGSYPLTINAANGTSPDAHQSFTLVVDQAPAITSATAASFTIGTSASFTVTSTGFPTAAMTESGPLPGGLHFTDNGNGTATLSGTPSAGTANSYPVTFNAANGTYPDVHQSFTLTVNQSPAFTSGTATTFTAGTAGTFSVVTTGSPTAAIMETGTLPSGVTLTDNGNGTATLGGKPADGTGGSYPITIEAFNTATPVVTQSFTLTVATPPPVVVATFVSGKEVVQVNNPDGTTRMTITPFPAAAYTQVNVALADINDDGTDDIIVGAGPGGSPKVKVFDGKTGAKIDTFFAFGSTFHGGVNVAAGDVNDDGTPDIIVGKGSGGPRVKVFNGANLSLMASFLAYSAGMNDILGSAPGVGLDYAGGVRVAAADLNHDGHADVVAVTGPGTRVQAAVFDGAALATDTITESSFFYAFGTIFNGGGYVATGDVNGDGTPDIIISKGPGGGPRAKVFNGANNALIQSFLAFSQSNADGVTVAAANTNGDAYADIVAASGPGIAGEVTIFNGNSDGVLQQFTVGGTSGLWVAGALT